MQAQIEGLSLPGGVYYLTPDTVAQLQHNLFRFWQYTELLKTSFSSSPTMTPMLLSGSPQTQAYKIVGSPHHQHQLYQQQEQQLQQQSGQRSPHLQNGTRHSSVPMGASPATSSGGLVQQSVAVGSMPAMSPHLPPAALNSSPVLPNSNLPAYTAAQSLQFQHQQQMQIAQEQMQMQQQISHQMQMRMMQQHQFAVAASQATMNQNQSGSMAQQSPHLLASQLQSSQMQAGMLPQGSMALNPYQQQIYQQQLHMQQQQQQQLQMQQQTPQQPPTSTTLISKKNPNIKRAPTKKQKDATAAGKNGDYGRGIVLF